MDQVLQYTIPQLHPLAVHFPLAFLLAAGGTAGVWMLRGTAFWRRATLLLTALGAAGAAFAYFTGEAMAEQAEGVPIVEELVPLHEDMALYTLLLSGAALAALTAYEAWHHRTAPDRPDALAARLGLGLTLLVLAALVAWTAHIGATMVWGVPR